MVYVVVGELVDELAPAKPLSRVDKLLRFVIGWLIRTDT